MRLLLNVLMILSVSIFAGGCAQKAEEKSAARVPPKTVPLLVHGTMSSQVREKEYGMAAVVKKQFLVGYDAAPVGAAIDGYRYFIRKEWKETRNAYGSYYIDLTGWLDTATLDSRSIKEGIAGRGIQIKFAIHENGSFGVAMVSKIEVKTDGKQYASTMDDSKDIMNRIYANKEITF